MPIFSWNIPLVSNFLEDNSSLSHSIVFHYFFALGKGNGTRLQYSCLGNPTDGGAWWATVHGVLRSWTWLNDFTFTFHLHALEKEMATHSSVLAWRIPGTGAWWAAIYGVAQSRTWLKWLSSSSSFALITEEGLFFLAILWNSAFKWVYLSFSLLPFASLIFTAISKALSDNHFAFLHFLFLGMVLLTASCTISGTSVHSSSGTLSYIIPSIYLSLPLYSHKGSVLGHTWMV